MKLSLNIVFLFAGLLSLMSSGSCQRRPNVVMPPEGTFLFPDSYRRFLEELENNPPNSYSNENVENRNYNNVTEDELPLELAIMFNEAEDIDDVISNIISNNDEFLKAKSENTLVLASRFGDDDSEESESTIASWAHCAPQDKIVKLSPNDVEVGMMYIPTCTRVPRCAGCCSNDLLQCEPTKIKEKIYKIKQLKNNGKTLKFHKYLEVPVEEHISCNCNCRIKKEDCKEFENYDAKNCICECKNAHEKRRCRYNNKKQWDANNCQCVCKEVEDCPFGLIFDDIICACAEE